MRGLESGYEQHVLHALPSRVTGKVFWRRSKAHWGFRSVGRTENDPKNGQHDVGGALQARLRQSQAPTASFRGSGTSKRTISRRPTRILSHIQHVRCDAVQAPDESQVSVWHKYTLLLCMLCTLHRKVGYKLGEVRILADNAAAAYPVDDSGVLNISDAR